MNALDQKRVDACVNACAGTTTADLVQIAANGGWHNLSAEWKLEAEAHADNADSFADRITELEQQRDELRAALKDAVSTIEWMYGCTAPADDEVEKAIREGNEAIAKADNNETR